MTEGKWTCSKDEEHWDCGEEFDTKELAIDYARFTLAPEYGLEDGDWLYVGQQRAIRQDDLARAGAKALGAWSALEGMQEYLFENVGDGFEDAIKASKEAEDDLDKRLEATVLEWMKAHDIKAGCFTLDHVESFRFEQCICFKPEEGHPDNGECCILAIGHSEEHEYP